MKKTTVIVLGAVFVCILLAAAAVYPQLAEQYGRMTAAPTATVPVSTNPAADFTVYDADGASSNLSDYTGRPVVVNFWATWCGYCVAELPDFNTLYAEYKDKVTFLMVDLPDGYRETQEGALAYIDRQGYTFPVFFDTDYSASTAYSVRGIPMTLLVNADGSLYKTHSGQMSESALRRYLELLTGENS